MLYCLFTQPVRQQTHTSADGQPQAVKGLWGLSIYIQPPPPPTLLHLLVLVYAGTMKFVYFIDRTISLPPLRDHPLSLTIHESQRIIPFIVNPCNQPRSHRHYILHYLALKPPTYSFYNNKPHPSSRRDYNIYLVCRHPRNCGQWSFTFAVPASAAMIEQHLAG